MSARLFNILNAIVAPFGKTLWEGTWSSGSITVPDSTKYVAYILTVTGTPTFGLRADPYVMGSSVSGTTLSTTFQQYIKVSRISVSGNTWTIDYIKQLNHMDTGSTAHVGSTTAQSITKIVGLIPKWGG